MTGVEEAWPSAWAGALGSLADRSHLATGDQLAEMVDRAVRPIGLTGDVLLVDLAQRALHSVRPGHDEQLSVEGTLAGRAYQFGQTLASTENGTRVLWVPMLDGTERVGVLHLWLGDDVVDDPGFRARCWSLAGLMGHILMTKIAYSDRLRVLRSSGSLSPASELLWQLVPPRTFATDEVVVSALLEPYDRVAGDAYDYAVDDDVVNLAVFDGVGHDLSAGLTTALAMTAIRNARRAGTHDLATLATRADELLVGRPGSPRFVTAVLARLEVHTGALHYLVAGHPPPLLVRDGHIVKELDDALQRPLGVPTHPVRAQPGYEQLEPGDRLLFYSDGIVEARDATGGFFGTQRLLDLIERAELDHVAAPETLRRLAAAVLAHQHDQLQDDATLLMLDWSAQAYQRMLPPQP